MAGRTVGRVKLPSNPGELLVIAKKIYDKHIADGPASPLLAQEDYDWSLEGPKLAPCIENNTKADEARKKAEELYRARDVDFPAIKSIVQNSAQLLKSIYAKNPKKLGDYGLVVDDTKPVKKPKP